MKRTRPPAKPGLHWPCVRCYSAVCAHLHKCRTRSENERDEVVATGSTVAREASIALDAIVQAIQERNLDKDSDEVYTDITKVVGEVRRERYARH